MIRRLAPLARVAAAFGLVVAAVAASALGSVATAGSAAAQSTATASEGCTRVDVLLLMDTSASLRQTDADDQRVAAAEVLLRSLASSASAGGTTVDVTVASFGSDAVEAGRATLPADATAAVDVVRSFADREGDLNTDYVLALRFAVQHFQAVTDLPSSCKRLVWFTDGAYSIDDLSAPGVATYTSSTDRDAVVGELGGQICGALPGSSLLTAPIAQEVRQTGFVVQLLDLRSGTESPGEQRDRDATTPVIDRLLSGDANDPCTVPGGRVVAGQAGDLAAEFFTQGQIALGRAPVPCAALAAGYPSPLVRAVTVRGTSPDQALAVTSGGQQLAQGAGFVTWVRSPDVGGPAGPSVAAGAVDGAGVAGCYADLSATILPVGSTRVQPGASSTTLAWTVLGVGGVGGSDPGAGLGPDVVSMGATVDGTPAAMTWDEASRTWQVVVPGSDDSAAPVPVVAVTATAAGFGPLATTSSALEAGASLAAPRVVWSGPTVLEGRGSFGGRISVVPAPVPEGAPIPDGLVCISFGAATSSAGTVALTPGQARACHPAGEAFEVNATVAVSGDQNDTVLVGLPFTVTHRPVGAAEDVVVATGQTEMPSFELTKPVDALQSALITVVIVGLSTLLPLALLVLLLNAQRRLPDPSSRRLARVPLVVDGGEVRRLDGAVIAAADLVPVEGTRSAYRLPSGLSLVRPRTLNPFAPTVVEARCVSGSVSAVPWMAPGAGRAVQVPAGFEDLVLILSVPGSDEAEAVVVLPVGADAADADRIVDRALARTNRLWSRVSSAMRLVSA